MLGRVNIHAPAAPNLHDAIVFLLRDVVTGRHEVLVVIARSTAGRLRIGNVRTGVYLADIEVIVDFRALLRIFAVAHVAVPVRLPSPDSDLALLLPPFGVVGGR